MRRATFFDVRASTAHQVNTLRRTAMKPILLRHTALAFLLLGSALAISATPKGASIPVHYQDLDLSKPQDAKVLYRRISIAARRVCNPPGTNDLAQLAKYSECYDTAVTNAVTSVNQQTLTALHQSRAQRSLRAG
jgi:UrcA family protein